MILVLPNQCDDGTVKCKKKKPLNVTKVLSNVMLYYRMWQWNHQIWEKKNKGTTKCDKIKVTYDVRTAQCKDGTIKCKKK